MTTPDRADVHVHDYGAAKVACSRPECATSSAPTCLECGAVAFDPYAGACDKCGAEDRWLGSQWQKVPLATPDPRLRSDGPEPDRADPERGGMLTTERERDAYLEGHAKGVEDARRADPERRAEGLRAALVSALRESVLRHGDEQVATWTGHAGDGLTPEEALADALMVTLGRHDGTDSLRKALEPFVRAADGRTPGYHGDRRVYTLQINESTVERARAALTSPPAGNELEEGK